MFEDIDLKVGDESKAATPSSYTLDGCSDTTARCTMTSQCSCPCCTDFC